MSHCIKNLQQTLAFQLEEVYVTIKKLQQDLPAATKAITEEEMKSAFNSYRNHLDEHRLKLKRIFGYLLSGPYGIKASVMSTPWSEIENRDVLPRLRDIMLGNSLQNTIQYVINAYVEARYIAMRLELDSVVRLLDEMLDAEEEFLLKIKRLSATQVNHACLMATAA